MTKFNKNLNEITFCMLLGLGLMLYTMLGA
jgi:hypothetical protein